MEFKHTNINFNDMPKQFIDSGSSAYGKDTMVIGLSSGQMMSAFVTTPAIFKSIALLLTQQVANYEKYYGEIDLTVKPIPSPFMTTGGNPSGNNEK